MNRLEAGQQLTHGSSISSDNGWIRLTLSDDGILALTRDRVGIELWRPPTTAPIDCVAINDGRLVALDGNGTSLWAVGEGAPARGLVVTNSGDLRLETANGDVVWQQACTVSWDSPTIEFDEPGGYQFVETSEWWQAMCEGLPCFDGLAWPGYDAVHLDVTLKGKPAVIQLWKGWCQKFLFQSDFPGGVGAEVGVYRRISDRGLPDLSFLAPPQRALVQARYASADEQSIWWPAPELVDRISFTLINPVTGQEFFVAGPERTYWLCRWMQEASYLKYAWDLGLQSIPALPNKYILAYTVNDVSGQWP